MLHLLWESVLHNNSAGMHHSPGDKVSTELHLTSADSVLIQEWAAVHHGQRAAMQLSAQAEVQQGASTELQNRLGQPVLRGWLWG